MGGRKGRGGEGGGCKTQPTPRAGRASSGGVPLGGDGRVGVFAAAAATVMTMAVMAALGERWRNNGVSLFCFLNCWGSNISLFILLLISESHLVFDIS